MPHPWWSSSSLSPSSSSSPNSEHHRRLTRAKQLRHLRDHEIKDLDYFCLNSPARDRHRHRDAKDLSRTASSPPPQPLPLPDLSTLFIRSDKFRRKKPNSGAGGVDNFRLPSPDGAATPSSVTDSDKEKERERARVQVRVKDNGSRVVPQAGRQSVDAQKRVVDDDLSGAAPRQSIHRAETWSPKNVPQKINGVDPFRSAPSSTNASPRISPRRMLNGETFSLNPKEPNPRCESCMVSRDSSPLHSPQIKSPIPARKSTSTLPSSPRHPKLSIEISSTHRDSNVLMNVHPLPLPPTPSSSAQTSPVPQVVARPELLPMKGQWTKGKLIGRGTFGSVYVATNRQTGGLCAMKEVELLPDDPRSAECMRQLEQEINVLRYLKHPNIVQYYGSEIVDARFYIYLEYVYPGSINKYAREHCGSITEAIVRNFTRHIVSGLAYLHARKTIHRDIKGANLLVDASGVVKLADFGMAKHLTGQVADLSLKGSPHWMAPELMQAVMQKDNSSDLAFAVDIWSLGCTVIEMLTGKPPWSGYEGAAAMFKVLRESPPIPETLSREGKDFLHCCFRRNPAERPPASKLLDHPFLRNSQQLDDKACSPREVYDRKLDKAQMSPSRRTSNGKSSNNETGLLLTHLETCDLTTGSRHSPRSILDPLTGLSPPRSCPAPKLLVSPNTSSSITKLWK